LWSYKSKDFVILGALDVLGAMRLVIRAKILKLVAP
jgi:hypothetical protein